MTQPLTLDETIVVDRPLPEVFAYLADFSRIEQWDPGVARACKLTPGAPGVGTGYRIDMKAGFSLHYTVVEFEPQQRLLMTVDSRLFTAREEILVRETDTGTAVRYIARFDFPRPLALANRIYPALMERVGKATMAGLQRALEDDFEPPAASSRTALADRLVLPGIWRFTRLGYATARKRWQPVSAYLGGRHAIVTGATSGLGLATATGLAALGARLTLVARDAQKARDAAAEITRRTGNGDIAVELCDLSLMSEVHALADRLLATDRPVDILVNNAGALFNPRQQTKEGLEKSFALLLLSPFILTERLQPLLARAGAAGHGPARVVNILSGGMYTQKIRVDDLQSRRGEYSGSVAYARAKRGLMILTEEWAGRWQEEGICVNAMHPGWADTPGIESSLPAFYSATRRLLRRPAEGADTAVWLAAATEAGKVAGRFWLDREQHPSHVFSGTRETAAERRKFLTTLEELMESTRPGHSGRGRRASRAAQSR